MVNPCRADYGPAFPWLRVWPRNSLCKLKSLFYLGRSPLLRCAGCSIKVFLVILEAQSLSSAAAGAGRAAAFWSWEWEGFVMSRALPGPFCSLGSVPLPWWWVLSDGLWRYLWSWLFRVFLLFLPASHWILVAFCVGTRLTQMLGFPCLENLLSVRLPEGFLLASRGGSSASGCNVEAVAYVQIDFVQIKFFPARMWAAWRISGYLKWKDSA